MSDRHERLRDEAWRWWHLAEEDLRGAQRFADDAELAPRLACFWAQQAAELALKAVLVTEDVDPPKSHDLADLADRSDHREIADLDRTKLLVLSKFAVAARHPADAIDITDFTPALLIAIAGTTLDAAETVLRRAVGADPAGDEG